MVVCYIFLYLNVQLNKFNENNFVLKIFFIVKKIVKDFLQL
jgi:hypothetical protein